MALKRIQREIEKIGDIVQSAEFDAANFRLILIDIKSKKFTMDFPDSYPFHPPKNLIVDNERIIYSKIGNNSMIYKFFNIKCMCCKSLLCSYNWNPSKTVEDIIKEYYKFKEISNSIHLFEFLINKKSIPEDIIKNIAGYINL